MSPLTVGFLGLVALMALIALRAPIGLALVLVAFFGTAQISGFDISLSLLQILPFTFAANWELTAIPMFLLMGSIVHRSGMAEGMFEAARLWLGALPGGLAVAANFACAGFSAATGSSLAAAMAIGRVTIPLMRRNGYSDALAAGVVASAGTLGILIPPSIIMVIYGIFAEVSISKLFIAGIVPGILTAMVYGAQIMIRCIVNPSIAPPVKMDVTWGERWFALLGVAPMLLLVLGVIGAIYGGLTTPTEAGAVGCIIAFLIVLTTGRFSFKLMRECGTETIRSTASIYFIIIGATLITRFMAFAGVPDFLSDIVGDWAASPLALVIAAAAMYLILGCFLDSLSMMLLTLPFLLPMLKHADIDLVWFGILLVKFIEISLLTPPVGLNVYAIKVITPDIPLARLFAGVVPFLLCEVLIVGLLVGFPEITLWLTR